MQTVNYLKRCLFFDIETTSRHASFEDFQENEPELAAIWLEKASQNDRFKHDPEGSYVASACLYPEYGKIVSIAYGYWNTPNGKWAVEYVDVESQTEEEMLEVFARMINTNFRTHQLCGFNIKNFDIPFVYRRMLISGILPPSQFDVCEKKPWEIKAFDLYKAWSDAGSITGMGGFDVICHLMKVPSPKGGSVSGKNVGEAYFEGKIEEISKYCRKDVQASIRLAVAMSVDKLREINPTDSKATDDED